MVQWFLLARLHGLGLSWLCWRERLLKEHVIDGGEDRFRFPRWANYLLPACVAGALIVFGYVPAVVFLGASPRTTDVGYAPVQPVPFSHAQHAGQLGIDCRYCHSTVEQAAFAALPATQTCMNCHATIRSDSLALKPVRDSFASGQPIAWKKVHDLPDYAYFNHAAHVIKGVGCVTCHGQVDQMDVVRQVKTLSMAWCLECHRQPENALRPREQVTNMMWAATSDAGKPQRELGLELMRQYHVQGAQSLTNCSTCHR